MVSRQIYCIKNDEFTKLRKRTVFCIVRTAGKHSDGIGVAYETEQKRKSI
mgnify:CR=1 FL=1